MSTPPQASPQAKAATDRFLAFYAVLAEVKRMAVAMAAPVQTEPPAADSAPAAPEDEEPDAETEEASPQQEALSEPAGQPASAMDLFLRLRVAICPSGSPPPSLDGYPDIGYIMAAMADEAMLHHVDWPGRHGWLHTLLEDSLYGSRIAGERLFELGEAIANGDIAGRDDLAVTILLALSLDFRGRWRGISDQGAIETLRKKLYETVYGQSAPEELDWHSALPSALKPVLDQGRLIRLPRVLPWLVAIGAVLLMALSLSALIWNLATKDVLLKAKEIQTIGATITRGSAQ